MVIRRVGRYIAALCVSTATLTIAWQVIDHFFGVVTGIASVALVLGSLAVFVVLTAWMYSVLAAPKPVRVRSRQPLE